MLSLDKEGPPSFERAFGGGRSSCATLSSSYKLSFAAIATGSHTKDESERERKGTAASMGSAMTKMADGEGERELREKQNRFHLISLGWKCRACYRHKQ